MFIVIFIALLISAAANTTFHPCGGLLNTSSIQINPTYIVPGEDLSITLRVSNGYETIDDGLVYYSVIASGVDEMPQVDDLCDIIQCPIRFGTSKVKIPLFVPLFNGNAKIMVKIMMRDLTQLICVQIETTQSNWLRSIFSGLYMPAKADYSPPNAFSTSDV